MGRSEPLVTGHRPVIVLIALTLATLMALAAVPAKGASETPSVKVMSRNLYLGADLMPVVAAPDIRRSWPTQQRS